MKGDTEQTLGTLLIGGAILFFFICLGLALLKVSGVI
jgi:hypothetical protein